MTVQKKYVPLIALVINGFFLSILFLVLHFANASKAVQATSQEAKDTNAINSYIVDPNTH
jgi:hypothetical protein